MDKSIKYIRNIGATIYALYLLYVFAWNNSNHTGFEPLYLLAIPLTIISFSAVVRNKQIRKSLIVTSITMAMISVTIEATNGMVNYQRWASSGMPEKWSW